MSAAARGPLAAGVAWLLVLLAPHGFARPAAKPASLEAVVRSSAPEGWRIDVLDASKVAATANADTTVLFTALPSTEACPEQPAGVFVPWRADTAEIIHQATEHAFTTCSTTALGTLKVHATYKDDVPRATPPAALIALVQQVLKQLEPPPETAPDHAPDAELDDTVPEPPNDSSVDDVLPLPPAPVRETRELFLRANMAGLYEHHAGSGATSAGAGGIGVQLLGVIGANFGVDFATQLAFDGRGGDLDDSRLIGFTYDIRLGAVLGAQGEAGAIGLAGGAGSDAISSPRFEDRPNVPPAAYLYASPFVHLRLSRCFAPEAQAIFALRSSYSHGLRVHGGLGIGCLGTENDTTGRVLVGGYWQRYPDRDVTGLGALLGLQLVTE